jgi:hypothetical protein
VTAITTASTGQTDDDASQGSVIIMSYPYGGGKRLWSLLSASPALACTSGTGILPLCDQAAGAWRMADGRGERLSRLAITSTRALTSSLITALIARQGGRRWCEFTTAAPRSAQEFLQFYPGTRFICLHRNCADVVTEILDTSIGEMHGSELSSFFSTYPSNTVAALTAYWVARTQSLVAFEKSNSDICRRIRYENLTETPVVDEVIHFLGLQDFRTKSIFDDLGEQVTPSVKRTSFRADQIPDALRRQANALLDELDYPRLGTGEG